MNCRSLVSGLFALGLVVAAPAQEVKTIFARTLHVVIPGEVAPGGVSWAKDSFGLPRAWSGEGEGTRTEVAEEGAISDAAAQQARLKELLPGAELSPVWVSGTRSWQGAAGEASILGVPLKSGFWIVLSKGGSAAAVTASVCAERDASLAGYMPRTVPGGLSMVLPYNFAPRRNREGWEMKIADGFEIDLRLDRAESGKKLDIKSTMDKEVNDFKTNKAYSDVKIERNRMRDLGDGEMALIKYKEGGRAREKVSVMGTNDGAGIQLSWVFDPARADHRDISNRIAMTFKKTKDAPVAGERFECGNGFSFETSAALERVEKGMVTEWVGSTGGLVVTARHVADSRQTDASGAAGFFPDLIKAQTPNAENLKVENVPYMVNGVDGILVKAEYKGAWRYGLFLATFEGIYVLDVLGMNKAEVEQTIRSAQLTVAKAVDPLKSYEFKGTPLKVLNLDGVTHQEEKAASPYKSLEIIQLSSAGEGVFQTAMHLLDDDEKTVADLPGVTKNYVEEYAKAMKGKQKILNQGWQSDNVGAHYWIVFEIEANGQKFKGYLFGVADGKAMLLQTSLLISDDPSLRGMNHIIMNSYRLSQP